MGNTIYASFSDPSLAEKAAGALLDRGVRSEDISVVRSHNGQVETTNYAGETETTRTYGSGSDANRMSPTDGDNDAKNAADATGAKVEEGGNRIAATGDRVAGWAADVVGAEGTADRYRGAAERREDIADGHSADASREFRDATDQPAGSTYGTTGTSASNVQTTNTGYGDTAYRTSNVDGDVDNSDVESAAKHGISTTTPADAGAGAIKGTAWGAGIGAVAALAALMVPGVGLVLGGGALAAALGGVAASAGAGAAAGAITGYLKDQGLDEHVASHYDTVVTGGGAILAVTVPSGKVDESEARMVLDKYGAGNINSYASSGGYVS